MLTPPRLSAHIIWCTALLATFVLLSNTQRAQAVTVDLSQASGPIDARPGWQWPVATPAVTRAYDAPETEYSSGHRGVDVRAIAGDKVFATHDGVVSFVGQVAGTLIVSLRHDEHVSTTYLPVISTVILGQTVTAGALIGTLAPDITHCSCLHLGLRYNGYYMSPLVMLGRIPRSVLLPW